jgi:hypothetical protein
MGEALDRFKRELAAISTDKYLTPTEEKEFIKLIRAMPKGKGNKKYTMDRKTLNLLRKENT